MVEEAVDAGLVVVAPSVVAVVEAVDEVEVVEVWVSVVVDDWLVVVMEGVVPSTFCRGDKKSNVNPHFSS